MADIPSATPVAPTTAPNTIAPSAAPPSTAAPTTAPSVAPPTTSVAPPTATTTPTPSQTQTVDAATLGQPTIPISSLPQEQPYTPPTVPTISSIVSDSGAPTPSQSEYQNIENEEGDLTTKLGGQSGDYNALTTQYNIPGLMQTANDLNTTISTIQAQRDSALQQLSSASKGYGLGAYLNFQNKMTDGELAARQSAATATLAAINGQISTAQTYIDAAIKNKYDPITNQINALKDQADMVKDTLDNEQTKQLTVMQAELTQREDTIKNNQTIASSMLEKIATAAANSANPAPSYVVTQAQKAALSDDPASALGIISPYLQDPLAAKQEIADIQSKNAATADSEADIAYKQAETAQISAGAGGAAIGTTGSPTIDTTTQGYSSTAVVGQYTQADIDQKALSYLTSGTQPPIGRTGAAGALNAAVSNRMAEISPGGNLAANKTQLAALSSSLKQQTDYLNTVQRSVSNAEAGFQQVTSAFQGKVNLTGFPSINAAVNAVKGQIDPGTITAYQAGLTEVANEYTQVFSRGGTATDAVRSKATSIANGDLSVSDLQQVLSEVQAQGNIVVNGSQAQVKSIQDQINGIINTNGGSSSVPTTGTTGTLPNGTVVTVQADGTITDAKGNKYDQDGNPL